MKGPLVSLDVSPRPPVSAPVRPHPLPASPRLVTRARDLLAPPWPRRLAVGMLAFAVAFALDRLTGQRYSSVLGSVAILVAALALVPALRRLALPVTAWTALWIGFNLLRAVGNDVPWASATAPLLPNLENRLFGGPPSALLQHTLYQPGHPGPLDALAAAVHLSFFVVPHVVAAVLLVRSRPLFRRYLLATTILLATSAALFALLPTAPPWLAPDPAKGEPVTRITHVVLAQAGLVSGASTGFAFERNPFAALPSIHLGATALIAAAAITTRRYRLPALLYAVAMGLALVYLGEHHVLDVLAGGALAAIAWQLAARILTEVDASWDLPDHALDERRPERPARV